MMKKTNYLLFLSDEVFKKSRAEAPMLTKRRGVFERDELIPPLRCPRFFVGAGIFERCLWFIFSRKT